MTARNVALFGGGPTTGPVTLVSDTFTRADNASSLGNAETGQAWVPGNFGDIAVLPTYGVSGNKAYCPNGGDQTDPHEWAESGFADVTITANVTVTGPAYLGLLFRRLDSSNYFSARLNTATNDLTLLRNLGGVRANRASVALAQGDPQVIALKVVLSGTSILVYADTVLLITYTDSNFQTATKHGLYINALMSTARIDNFLVTK